MNRTPDERRLGILPLLISDQALGSRLEDSWCLWRLDRYHGPYGQRGYHQVFLVHPYHDRISIGVMWLLFTIYLQTRHSNLLAGPPTQ